ncbi:uncharacterized protein LOC129888825 [Solanum dulcamara]|uniref:uncharacterized protein LOC129888825 n=1 Tax=Solanum dulcamara TaxID=45834 RepID=UPI002486AC78|nr:uncharacterized protein LOC129888825 [Solanum dulcamara]
MDQNLAIVAKKVWKLVRVAMCMLRKGISKQKVMLDIKLMMKRRKIGSYKAAVQNLMFHFHHHHTNTRRSHEVVENTNLPFCPPHKDEYYEFSCSSSPNLNIKKQYTSTEEDVVVMNAAVMKALEMIKGETTSPDNYFRGFGRQLRVTDSPFPVRDEVEEESDNYRVDEAADEFISKFYRNLRRQSSLSAS